MNFEELEVWKRGVELSASIYIKLRQLRDYGFKEQITQSGLSVPSNIAEGFERVSQKEAMTFLSYAKGSSGELRTQVIIGMKIGYIPEEAGREWIRETKEISSMLSGLIKTKRGFLKNGLKLVFLFSGLFVIFEGAFGFFL
jgi:four helix bundle protein